MTPGGGYALLDTSILRGELLELTRLQEWWRFRSILRPAIIAAAEARASQSASYNTLELDIENWIKTTKQVSLRQSLLRGPRRVRAPRRRQCDGPHPLETRGYGRMETQRPHPQLSACGAPQSLSSALLPSLSGRQLVVYPRHVKRASARLRIERAVPTSVCIPSVC